MVIFVKPPKDALQLLAENLPVFEKIRDMWISSGNLLYADYRNGVYEAAALFYGKVVLMQYSEEKEEEIVEAPPDPADLD